MDGHSAWWRARLVFVPTNKLDPSKVFAKVTLRKASQRGDLAPDRVAAILKGLDEAYPNVECALTHGSPWELLVATILSAQCTDVRVNMVTPELSALSNTCCDGKGYAAAA